MPANIIIENQSISYLDYDFIPEFGKSHPYARYKIAKKRSIVDNSDVVNMCDARDDTMKTKAGIIINKELP